MIKQDDVVYSQASRDDLKDIYQFHLTHFGEIRSEYVWQWQYGNENSKGAVLVIGKVGGKIVATQGAIVIELIVRGKSVITGKNESLLIDPSFRKRGVFSSLYSFAFKEYKKAGMKLIWGFTKAEGPFRKVGFSFDKIVQRSILPLNSRLAVKLAKADKMPFLKAISYQIGSAVLMLYSKLAFKIGLLNVTKHKGFEVLNRLKEDGHLQDFYLKIRKEIPELIYINFSNDFLQWRIERSPNKIDSNYIYNGNVLEGYLITEKKEAYLDILDFAFLSERAGSEIMRFLNKKIRDEEIGFISYCGNQTNVLNKKYFAFLGKFGFLKIKGPSGLVIKSFRQNEGKPDLKDWYVTSLWYEGI